MYSFINGLFYPLTPSSYFVNPIMRLSKLSIVQQKKVGKKKDFDSKNQKTKKPKNQKTKKTKKNKFAHTLCTVIVF